MNEESKLTIEAKSQIKREFYRIAAPTGIFLAIFSFALGFATRDYGTTLAYKDAFSDAQKASTDQIMKLVAQVTHAQESVKLAELQTKKLLELVSSTEQVTNNANDIEDIAAIISNNKNFQNLIKQQLSTWKEVTANNDLFRTECEYRWLIVEEFEGYNGSYFYPSVVTPKSITTDWSKGKYRTVNFDKKNKSHGDYGTFEVRTFCRCN